MKRGRAMTWRDWFLMVAACLGVVVVITIIARTFELGGNQRGLRWLRLFGQFFRFDKWNLYRG